MINYLRKSVFRSWLLKLEDDEIRVSLSSQIELEIKLNPKPKLIWFSDYLPISENFLLA